MDSDFGKRLKSRRLELEMTQWDVALKANLTASAICQFETGSRFPNLKSLEGLSNALKVSVDYLIKRGQYSISDLTSDNRVSEMMKGVLTLDEKQKTQLFRVYEGLAVLYEKESETDGGS
ncbi:helix-turn-helix transcriptional regulator [Candidatus Poribacteria bacterium]|nr:helix-turn-helix transcriptional regulator [Candidatus Poribacteria bacterium]